MHLVAVSGGIDSMCLAEKVRLSGEPFAMAHCNFSLRGGESDGDEAFVRDWASHHGITCHVKRFDTAAYAASKSISIEMAARELRYRWFGELCREYGYDAILVAHNANDNAETLLLNLLRGTGLRGLVGMKASGFIPDPEYSDIPLLRPLLDMTREDIRAFAADAGLEWREDSTNAENGYKRNKLRNLVFPVLEDINPSFVRTLGRDMERFSREMTALSEGRPLTDTEEPASESEELPPLGYTITEEHWDGTGALKQPDGMLILDAGRIQGGLNCRNWQDGDRFRPLGLNGSKKLQDWFTDRHFSIEEKHRALIFTDESGSPLAILSPVASAIDRSVRVTSSTERIFQLRLTTQE